MISANLDLVRSIFADWERGDFSSTEWAHPEIEYVMIGGPSRARYIGLAQVAEGEREFLRPFVDFRTEAEEYRELDGERVVVFIQSRGRGKGSGLDVGQLRPGGTVLFEIRRGKVARLVVYWERDRALADLGLAQKGDSP
jgi:ketosteroid isomerase-like protein